MSDGKRYRIGEFARLAAASIKTLRFYDQLGLLKPRLVDARTRYRYYEAVQLRDLARIRALKELGGTLEDIRRVLSSDTRRARHAVLSRLRNDALRTLTASKRMLNWLELELEDVEQGIPETPVVLEKRGEMRIASIRSRLGDYAEVADVERDLARAVPGAVTGGLRGVLWHRCEAAGVIDGEAFLELRGRASPCAGLRLGHLPGAHVAAAWCESDDLAAVRTYDAIDRWIHRHELRLDGPKREIYVGPLLEIQFPVRPA